MKVIKANVIGFCTGVRCAIEIAKQTVHENPDTKIFTIGLLIHNSQAMQELEKSGIHVLGEDDTNTNLSNSIGIIRAHGISPKLRMELESRGMKLKDATCKKVIASQKKASAFFNKGIQVILAGDKNHAELIGISGFAPNALFVADKHEAQKLQVKGPCAIIAQTTIRREEFQAMHEELTRRGIDLTIVDSICPSTIERQEAVKELCKTCDAIVVAGGSKSANTLRLARLISAEGIPFYLVETAKDLTNDIFQYDTIGIASGTSTPDFVLNDIITELQSHSKNSIDI